MVYSRLTEASVKSSGPRGTLTDVRFATALATGTLTDAIVSTGNPRGKLTEVTVATANARGKLTEASIGSSNPKGKLTEAVCSTSAATGRLTEVTVLTRAPVLGYLGIGGSWVPVTGYLGVNGGWQQVKWWGATVDTPTDPPDPPDPDPDGSRGAVSFTTVGEARAFLGAPSDANYIVWDDAWTDQQLMLHQVFTEKLTANDILVLPERTDAAGNPIPYLVDSSNGFMASGVAAITGTISGGVETSRIPIVSNSRCWFEMARGRRGILGMGPKAVIEPSPSSFTRIAQPITENTGGTMAWYNAAGGKGGDLVGAQDALIGFDHTSPWVGNFTIRSRPFGGVAYSGLQFYGNSTVKNIRFDAASRGFDDVPNGETGSIKTNTGTYNFANLEIITTDSTGARVVSSPIMWNRTTGGTMSNVHVGRAVAGMPAMWRCSGTQTWTDVVIDGNDPALNLEEGPAGFVLNWTGGSISSAGQYHIIGESSSGSKKITLNNVTVTGGRDAASGALACHFYSYTGTYVQKKSDIVRVNPSGPVTGYAFML